MKKLYRFLTGYVEIVISGIGPERFLNLCQHHGLELWALQARDDGYHICISLENFKKLKGLVRKSRVRLRICRRTGLPFWLYRNRRRKLMMAATGCFFLLLYALSLFIWDIEFQGNLHYTDVQLRKFLRQNGYDCGMLVSDAGCEQLEKLIRNAYNDVTWVSAQIDGTRLVVHIKENDGYLKLSAGQAEEEEKSPSDLVADVSGTVQSIVTRSGTPKVSAGQEVKAGDVLISGLLEYTNDSQEIFSQKSVAADGDVLIETISEYQDTFSMTVLEQKPVAGKTGYFFRVFDRQFSLFSPVTPGDQEEQLVQEHQMKLFEHFYLPLYWGTIENTAYALEQHRYTEEEARAEGEKRLAQYLENLAKKTVQISSKNVIVQIIGDNCTVSAEVHAVYQAAERRPIPQENLLPKENQTEQNEHD